MALKIKPGSLPQWDEKALYVERLPLDENNVTQSLNPFQRNTRPFKDPPRTKRLGNFSIDDFFTIVAECLMDNQGYHLVSPDNKWRIKLPYARYLSTGDKIFNLTTGEEYKVKEVLNYESKDILLTGITPPEDTDRLRLEKQNMVRFVHDYPRSFASSINIDIAEEIADQPAPWTDTITYIITYSEPSTLDTHPFKGYRNLRPRSREIVENVADHDTLVEIESWCFDSIANFCCWAKTNARAVDLLEWFEDFMFRYKWIFILFGMSRVYYWERNEDEEVFKWRTDITKRSVKFLIRTERLHYSLTPKIKSIKLKASLDNKNIINLDSLSVPSIGILEWPEPSTISVEIEEGSL